MDNEPHKRRWFQFRLRTLFIITTLVATGMLGFVKYREYRQKREFEEMYKSQEALYANPDIIMSDEEGWFMDLPAAGGKVGPSQQH